METYFTCIACVPTIQKNGATGLNMHEPKTWSGSCTTNSL